MRILVLCREPRLYSCQRLKQAAENQGCQLDILDPNRFLLQLTQGKLHAFYQLGNTFDAPRAEPYSLPEYQGIIPRFGTASTEMGCRVLHHFELQGVPVLNRSEGFRLARDKWQSLQRLAAANLPVPPTVVSGELFDTACSLTAFSYPIIIKTLSGSQGVGVMLSEHQRSAMSLLDTFKANHINTLSQQFIPEARGEDIRAFVIGDQVVAAMQRIGKVGEFRANIHQGGEAKSITLSKEEQQLAVDASHVLGLHVAGVDLIRSANGLMILEVNASPGLEMIEKVNGKGIAEQMIAHLVQQCRT